MMTLEKFLKQIDLALSQPSYYKSGGWGKWDATKNKWQWDCVCFIKGILWGWNNDKTKPKGGGAKYASNGVPDCGTEEIIKLCKNVSSDFSTLQVGEIVWMQGHVGVCIAQNTIAEATSWKESKLFTTGIDSKGTRSYKGQKGTKLWKKHGFLPWIDYSQNPTPQPQPQPQPTPTPSKDFFDGKGCFKLGDTHENIGKIASFMRRMFPAYTSEKALGNYYGKNIESSIKEFQKRTGLGIDGKVGPKTLSKLESYGFKH